MLLPQWLHICLYPKQLMINVDPECQFNWKFTAGWLVGWGLTALLTQNRSYRACRFVGIFYSKL